MQNNLFSLSMVLPGLLLTAGLFVMLTGILRHNTNRFRSGLYYGVAASVVMTFVLAIRFGSSTDFNARELALMGTGAAMFIATLSAISYHYIHRVMPDFFVNSSLAFTAFCWLATGIILVPQSTTKADPRHQGHFMESHEYKVKKNASEATYAVHATLAQMPQ